MSWVVMYSITIRMELWCVGSVIFKTVQVNLYAQFMQGNQFVKHINNPPIIGGIGDGKGDNM